jgi:hypothetical protein
MIHRSINAADKACLGVGVALIAFTLWSMPSYAQDDYPDTLGFTAGSYYVLRSSTTVAYSPGDIPVSAGINLNRDLGLEQSDSSFRVDGYYRFNPKHRIDAAWYRVERTGSHTTSQDFSWNGQEYSAGWTVDSVSGNETFKVNYLYSFYHSPKVELAVGGGLHVTTINSAINVSSFGTNIPSDPLNFRVERELKTAAPLPVISLLLAYDISARWKVLWTHDVLFLEIDGISGDFSDSNLAVEFRAFKNVGFGLGYNRVGLNVEGEDDGDQYSAVVRYDAARLYVKAAF